MDSTLMDSTSLYGGSGQQKDPLFFLTSSPAATPTPSLQLYGSNGIGIEEMQKQKRSEVQIQKKRECDRRYRENKNKAVMETKNKLAMVMIENDNLKCTVEKLQQKNIQLTNRLKWFTIRFETIYAELEKEIKCIRTEKEFTECPLNDPNI